MILASRLNGFCPVELFQNHDPRQMVGEGHRPHGKLKIRFRLDSGSHAEGGADEKAGAAFAALPNVPWPKAGHGLCFFCSLKGKRPGS